MHVTLVEINKFPRDTHNNLNVSIVKECPSWTSHIGNGVFKFSTIGPHLKHDVLCQVNECCSSQDKKEM